MKMQKYTRISISIVYRMFSVRIFMKVRESQCINLPHLLSRISFAFHRATQYHLSSINIEIHVNQTNSREGIHRVAPRFILFLFFPFFPLFPFFFALHRCRHDRYIAILLIRPSIIRMLLVPLSTARHARVALEIEYGSSFP